MAHVEHATVKQLYRATLLLDKVVQATVNFP